jgi:hypothetical protein
MKASLWNIDPFPTLIVDPDVERATRLSVRRSLPRRPRYPICRHGLLPYSCDHARASDTSSK